MSSQSGNTGGTIITGDTQAGTTNPPTNPTTPSWYYGGTPTNIVYDPTQSGGGYVLASNMATGSFNSRSLSYGTTPITWSSLQWTTPRPFWKELPNNAGTETGYGTGLAHMNENLLLLHLDEAAGSTSFVDSSGNGNAVSCTAGTCPMLASPGRFLGAAAFDGATQFINAGMGPDIIGTGAFTVSAWIKTKSAQPQIIVQQRDPNTYKGEYQFGIDVNLPGTSDAVPGGLSFWTYQDGGQEHVTSSLPVNDGLWHHVAAVREMDGTLRIYLDGAQVAFVTPSGSSNISSLKSANVYIGVDGRGNNSPTAFFSGIIDEVSIFSRALAADEVQDHYLRGALRLKFQVRVCQTADCTGIGFVGPDGTANSFYSELNNALSSPGPVTLLGLAPATYLQYNAILETDVAALSPLLGPVSVAFTH